MPKKMAYGREPLMILFGTSDVRYISETYGLDVPPPPPLCPACGEEIRGDSRACQICGEKYHVVGCGISTLSSFTCKRCMAEGRLPRGYARPE